MSPKTIFYTPGCIHKEKPPSGVDIEAEAPDAATVLVTNDPTIIDFENPQDRFIAINWKPRKKWTLIIVLSSMTFITYILSSPFGIYTKLTNIKRTRLSNVCSGSTSTHGRIRFEK